MLLLVLPRVLIRNLDEGEDRLPVVKGDDIVKKSGIRCPKCRWRPRPSDRWQCSCLHVWNTFDTRGRCPGCRHQWEDTQCLQCHAWSRHADWYGT